MTDPTSAKIGFAPATNPVFLMIYRAGRRYTCDIQDDITAMETAHLMLWIACHTGNRLAMNCEYLDQHGLMRHFKLLEG